MLWGLLLALAGGFLGYRLKVPGGALIGSMLFVGAFNAFTGVVQYPVELNILSQAISGGLIGIGLDRKLFSGIRSLVGAAVMVAVFIQIIGVSLGLLLHKLTGYSIVTSLLSSAPGGVADMTLISMEMGADTAKVAVLHSFRLIAVLPICPPLIKLISNAVEKREELRRSYKDPSQQERMSAQHLKGESQILNVEVEKPSRNLIVRQNIRTIMVALAGGIIGYVIEIPAGTIVFAMIAVAIYKNIGYSACISRKVRVGTQIMVGALIGQSVNGAELASLGNLLPLSFIVIASYIFFNILVGVSLHLLFKIDIATALFATTPAGVSDMALIAADVGGNGPQVAILQIVRLTAVITFYPQIVAFIANL